jgi:hypothetical protein
MLTFDAERHEYFWCGSRVPGVTQVIRAALGDPFQGIPSHVLERKRAIGVAAHRACELDSQGRLDDATVHPAVLPYLEAWRAFVREKDATVVANHRKAYSITYGYAGELDFIVTWWIGDRDGGGPVFALVDFKTGIPGEMARIQTAGYAALNPEPCSRYSLQGLPNGRYKLEPYDSPGDFPDFLACLRVFRLKERLAA